MKTNGKGPALLRLNNQKRVMTQLRKLRGLDRGAGGRSAWRRPDGLKLGITLRPEKLKSAGIMVERNVIHWRVCDYFTGAG
ncbi:unnamed protein product [Peronospora farinosa]|uniref:Uncharacterized protein n=1 Tax=Peronospora farinosa TaxID=134698 RepID=A0ABN8CEE9_9STRA|nr:unnamed protein product [Peronospora farinosa]